jgi:hypothetical protein
MCFPQGMSTAEVNQVLGGLPGRASVGGGGARGGLDGIKEE